MPAPYVTLAPHIMAPRWRGLAAILALALVAAFTPKSAMAEDAPTIAITPFSFSDTSGEVQDQSAVHQARLHRFAEVLQTSLQKTGDYHVVALSCPSDPCAATPADGADLLKAAQKSGASLVVVGGVHKMSSLVIFMKADVYKVATDRPVFSKLYTFRGDNDKAWVRAAEFLAGEIKAHK
ncbi:MAG: DUF2380 domain-containing protein [Methylovirgula sp.]